MSESLWERLNAYARPRGPEEIMAEWVERKREEFGTDWNKVVAILRALERMGIYLFDVHPGNIKFRQ